jgi:hypothetical protein
VAEAEAVLVVAAAAAAAAAFSAAAEPKEPKEPTEPKEPPLHWFSIGATCCCLLSRLGQVVKCKNSIKKIH